MNLPPSLKSYANILRSLKKEGRPDPMRDWLLVLCVTMLLIVASVAWNAWFFLSTLSGEEAAAPAPVAEEADTSAVLRAKEAFEERARLMGESDARTFVDPS